MFYNPWIGSPISAWAPPRHPFRCLSLAHSVNFYITDESEPSLVKQEKRKRNSRPSPRNLRQTYCETSTLPTQGWVSKYFPSTHASRNGQAMQVASHCVLASTYRCGNGWLCTSSWVFQTSAHFHLLSFSIPT